MAFLFGVFCKVVRKYSVRVSFGCDLAPCYWRIGGGRALRGDGTDHSGWGFQGDKHKLNQGELGYRKEDEGRLWDASRGSGVS